VGVRGSERGLVRLVLRGGGGGGGPLHVKLSRKG
jgi:hypothetical protein